MRHALLIWTIGTLASTFSVVAERSVAEARTTTCEWCVESLREMREDLLQNRSERSWMHSLNDLCEQKRNEHTSSTRAFLDHLCASLVHMSKDDDPDSIQDDIKNFLSSAPLEEVCGAGGAGSPCPCPRHLAPAVRAVIRTMTSQTGENARLMRFAKRVGRLRAALRTKAEKRQKARVRGCATQDDVAIERPAVGQQLTSSMDSVRIFPNQRPIATGGFGSVFRGEIARTKTPVAVKVWSNAVTGPINSDHEANIMGILCPSTTTNRLPSCVSPHIAQYVGTLTDARGGEKIVIKMYPLGDALHLFDSKHFRACKNKPAVLLRLLRHVHAAAAAAHRLRIMHHDIKLGNIFVDGARDDCNSWSFKLGDWGGSVLLKERGSRRKERIEPVDVVGNVAVSAYPTTPFYAPPQAERRRPCNPIEMYDLWSIGVVIFDDILQYATGDLQASLDAFSRSILQRAGNFCVLNASEEWDCAVKAVKMPRYCTDVPIRTDAAFERRLEEIAAPRLLASLETRTGMDADAVAADVNTPRDAAGACKNRKKRGHVSAGHGRIGKHRKHPGGRGNAGGQHHHRILFDKYHPGYFGKVGMRHFHLKRNIAFRPTLNLSKLWTLVSEDVRKQAEAGKDSGKAPVIDVTKAGFYKVLG
eukprot:g4624.t1